jgi:type IV secretory pathway VirB2 component (pilin)
MSKRRFQSALALALLLVMTAAFPATAHAQDPFGTLENTVSSNAKLWAGAIVLIGAVIAGASIIMGSQNSGKWVGRFIGGSILLLLTLKGQALLQWLSSGFGVGQ